MNATVLVMSGALPAFALGWFGRDLYELSKGDRMRVIRRPVHHLFEWFAHGRRLVGLTVVTAGLAIAALGYTYSADQQSEGRTDRVVACVARYVDVLSRANLPRTAASVEANDARRDWDRGFSVEQPSMSKDDLKARYLRLYARYEKVREGNPLPEFSLSFCRSEDER